MNNFLMTVQYISQLTEFIFLIQFLVNHFSILVEDILIAISIFPCETFVTKHFIFRYEGDTFQSINILQYTLFNRVFSVLQST